MSLYALRIPDTAAVTRADRTPKYKADLQKRLENELIDAKVLRDAGLVGDLMIDKPKKHG
jgi:hypothetical protein